MTLKKKEDQSVGVSVLRRGNKMLTGGNTESKCGAETEGRAIQRLPGDPSHIQSPKPEATVDPVKCLRKPDMAVS